MTGAGTQPPGAQGLYDPRHEHDACGVGFVVNIKGRRSHAVIEQGLQLLINLLHRGACGCEANTGDGAGILIQMPDRFLRKVTGPLGIQLPEAGQYGAGLVFLPRDRAERRAIESLIVTILEEEDLKLLGWREVPADNRLLGARAVAVAAGLPAPVRRPRQALPLQPRSGGGPAALRTQAVRRPQAHRARGRSPHAGREAFFYVVSLSARTLIYKGMLTADQIAPLFPDLTDPRHALRAGARAPALQHQHVSVVAARAPVPVHRPQRRDQHAARQHQLDARARGAARSRRSFGEDSRRFCRSSARAAPTRRPSTTCSSSSS